MHHDPVVSRQSVRVPKRQGRKSDASKKCPSSARGLGKLRREQVNADAAPHDDVPTFLRVVPRIEHRRDGLTSCGSGCQCSDDGAKATSARRQRFCS